MLQKYQPLKDRRIAISATHAMRTIAFTRVLQSNATATGLLPRSDMPRQPRTFIPGISHHVIQRGNNRCVIFRVPTDYRFFLSLLARMAQRYRADIHGYVLMTTHFHLIVTPATANSLPRMMQGIGRLYVPFYNEQYERTGTLWERRYRSSMLSDERYWMTCLRYVEMNPVRSGLTDRPEKYPWSSYRAHAFGREDGLLSPHPLYAALGTTDAVRQEGWRTICAAPIPAADLDRVRQAVHAGHAIGEPVFHEVASG
jgi:putative transposase